LGLLGDIKIVGHHEGILQGSESVEAGVGKLRVMLVHLVDRHGFHVDLWESEVTLLKNIFLVELWNTLHVGSGPSFEHDLSEVGLVLIDSIGGARVA
jgi:hypothetical protein